MRTHGTRFECMRMRPHDHIGWVFTGPGGFAALATPFLAEGAVRGEKLVYVTEEPSPAAAGLAEVVGWDALEIVSIAEVYGASGIVDAARQRATFAQVLAEALAAGSGSPPTTRRWSPMRRA